MRFGTFNVLHGRPLGSDGRPVGPVHAVPSRQLLADAVSDLDVDVLSLQEVDRYQPRSGDIDQAQVAAVAMGAADWRYASALHGRAVPGAGWRTDRDAPALGVYGPGGAYADDAYGRDDDATPSMARAYGTALLTRLPVLDWRVRRLPGARVPMPLAIAGRGIPAMVRDHPRVAIAAVLDGARGPFTVVATHLSFVPGWNAGQLAVLPGWLAGLPRPRVLLGDLNLTGAVPRAVLEGAELLNALTRRAPRGPRWHDLARTATYPAHRPLVQFDHVLAAGIPGSAVRSSSAGRAAISDHRALVVELDA